MEFEQSREIDFWRNWVREYIERQKPGIDRHTAQLHSSLINTLLDIPEIRADLMRVLGRNIDEQKDLEFDRNENHWKFIRNNNGVVGDFRLIRLNNLIEEEQSLILIRDGGNRFAYWNKSYPNSPKGVRIFRGPDDPSARKIQEMIDKLS